VIIGGIVEPVFLYILVPVLLNYIKRILGLCQGRNQQLMLTGHNV